MDGTNSNGGNSGVRAPVVLLELLVERNKFPGEKRVDEQTLCFDCAIS